MVEFCNRGFGRIGVYSKCVEITGFTSVMRIGTIKYDNALKEHLFFQDWFGGSGTKINISELDAIREKIKELNLTRCVE